MTEPTTRELQEEIRLLRSAVTQLTALTQGMYHQMVRHDLVPIPEFSRWAGDLRLAVLDEEARKIWEGARGTLAAELQTAAERQHPE
ncbi:hypothetical protein ASE70_14935 [Sphingomonas sp. Leaf22]|uniref:hypothetical protein n=1 Tax=Sphingomonas sp. Leaf22 TaxID=1735687 RepID=UPI0006F3387F|nr:hypothetical protein [Sphingomonas sp. Leaf22]KQM92207.1 hypothetical protein ASE70_14935 [Sphingomonas sp. Leaf22]